MKILFVLNEPSFFVSHRLAVAQAAMKRGFDVHVATCDGTAVEKVVASGFTHHVVPFTRSGKNPFVEIWALLKLALLFVRLKPDLLHLVTIKPVLYGGFLSRVLRIRGVVAAISGLGSVFRGDSSEGILRFFIVCLYKISLRKKNIRVIFQNPDDRETLLSAGIVKAQAVRLIKGSGVDLCAYPALEEPDADAVKVVMAARLLREKGVFQFVEAARILQSRSAHPRVRFVLVGEPDPGNPSTVLAHELDAWQQEDVVDVLGYRDDIAQVFAQSHIVVLPSYYGEGLPKVLIEAAACGRPVVTTDHPGCRDAIVPDVTGLLVPVKDGLALADAVQWLVEHAEQRRQMGRAARTFAEQTFSVDRVVDQHLRIYKELA